MRKHLPKFLVGAFVCWAASYYYFNGLGNWELAGNIGDSFGAVSAFFSGVALFLAIYSMALQQEQSAEFEQRTLKSEQRMVEVMQQQSRAIALIEQSLAQQINAGRVSALTFMVERQEERIERLRDWGRNQYQNENHYGRGIEAASRRIADYEAEIARLGAVR